MIEMNNEYNDYDIISWNEKNLKYIVVLKTLNQNIIDILIKNFGNPCFSNSKKTYLLQDDNVEKIFSLNPNNDWDWAGNGHATLLYFKHKNDAIKAKLIVG